MSVVSAIDILLHRMIELIDGKTGYVRAKNVARDPVR